MRCVHLRRKTNRLAREHWGGEGTQDGSAPPRANPSMILYRIERDAFGNDDLVDHTRGSTNGNPLNDSNSKGLRWGQNLTV